MSPAMRQVMGLRPALKLCNPILHRHPPRFSSLPPLILRRNSDGGGRRSPPHAKQRSPLPAGTGRQLAEGDSGPASPPPRNLRGAEPAEGRRGRLSAATHSALPPEYGKSRGGGRRGEPNLPARGLSLARAASAVRACAESEVFPNSGAAQAAGCARLLSQRRSGCCPTPGGCFFPGEVAGRETSPRGTPADPAGGGSQGEGRPGSGRLPFPGGETKRGSGSGLAEGGKSVP